MNSAAPDARETTFPGLRPEVVRGYLNAPEHLVAEVLDGELFLMPRPRPRHALAAVELAGELRGPFRLGRGGPGAWIFLPEPELHLGTRPDIIAPELAGWHRDRLPSEVFDDEAPGAIATPLFAPSPSKLWNSRSLSSGRAKLLTGASRTSRRVGGDCTYRPRK